jgi:hypothetical protein
LEGALNWKLIAIGVVIWAFWEADRSRAASAPATGAPPAGGSVTLPTGYYLAPGAYGLEIAVPDGGFGLNPNALKGLRGLKLKPANPSPGHESPTSNGIDTPGDGDDSGDDAGEGDGGFDDEGDGIEISLDGFSDLDVDFFGGP